MSEAILKPFTPDTREARLIVPRFDNNGAPLDELVEFTREALAKLFGGFTETNAQGAFLNAAGIVQREPVAVFDIAGTASNDHNSELFHLARYVAVNAKQESVYLRDFAGRVQFVTQE